MPLQLRMIIFLYFVAFASAQSDAQEPAEAVIDSIKWLDCIDQSHDLSLTIHRGVSVVVAGKGERDSFEEAVVKCRHISDAQSGAFFIAFGRGTTKIEVAKNSGLPVETSLACVRYGAKDWIKESRIDGRAMQYATCPTIQQSCIQIGSPIDFRTLCPCHPETFYAKASADDERLVLDRLATVDPERLTIQKHVGSSKKQICYWITSDKPYANSIGLPATKLVVSDEGFDKGKVIEIHFGALKLDDEKKYSAESKLLPYTTQANYTWKEFEFKSELGESQKHVLPIAVSKKENSYPYTSFLNATLEWNSIGKPIPKEIDLKYCEKLADEYNQAVNRVLKR